MQAALGFGAAERLIPPKKALFGTLFAGESIVETDVTSHCATKRGETITLLEGRIAEYLVVPIHRDWEWFCALVGVFQYVFRRREL